MWSSSAGSVEGERGGSVLERAESSDEPKSIPTHQRSTLIIISILNSICHEPFNFTCFLSKHTQIIISMRARGIKYEICEIIIIIIMMNV